MVNVDYSGQCHFRLSTVIRINRRTDYAIRVLLALAKRPPGTRLSSAQIRGEMLIPPALAQRIIAELARGGFLTTFPGRDGGVQLARSAAQINLRQVVEHFEGPILISDCMTARLDCPFENRCPVRRRWDRLQALICRELESLTFDQLALEALEAEGLTAAPVAALSVEPDT